MTLPSGYFDQMYAGADDPWGFDSRWYEHRKYDVTLAALTRPRFRRVFEPGCSVGVLTERLAVRCDELLAVDTATRAVQSARERVARFDQVTVDQMSVPGEWPDGTFDLVVLSEIGYYFSPEDLRRLIERSAKSLMHNGILVAVHWRHPVTDYPMSGDDVHRELRNESGLHSIAHHVEDDFVLDVMGAGGAGSVASETGLL